MVVTNRAAVLAQDESISHLCLGLEPGSRRSAFSDLPKRGRTVDVVRAGVGRVGGDVATRAPRAPM